MTSIFEKPWFKWAVVGTSGFLLFAITGTFFLKRYLDYRQVKILEENRKKALEEYEDQFRSTMTRIYQNKRLGHFLAAHKNLESLPPPSRADRLLFQEYTEVVQQVGQGLLENNMLKESESEFRTLRELEGQVSSANDALGKIESKKRLDNAHLLFTEGERLFKEERYRDAYNELNKAVLELESVDLLHFDSTKDDRERIKKIIIPSKFYTYLDDAKNRIGAAERLFKMRQFKDGEHEMSIASSFVGRAAFIRPEAREIKDLRQQLFNLDAELGYELPNSVPIWNHAVRDEAGKVPRFFFMTGYQIDPKMDASSSIKIGMQYIVDDIRKEDFYVVRYRIYFFNGESIFNGQYLQVNSSSDPTELETAKAEKIESILYEQEIPERFRKMPIQRIEIKVFNDQDVMVSQVTRAFRKPTS